MSKTRRLDLLREYAMLQAQVLELQRQMAAIEQQFASNESEHRGRNSVNTRIGKARKLIEAQKGEFELGQLFQQIGDHKAVQNAAYLLKKEGKLKRIGYGRYKSIAA